MLYEYDAFGNVVKAVDGNGNATFSHYDKLGRKIAQLDTEKYLTTWTYDAEGNVLTETRYANRDNRLYNSDFVGTDGWYTWNPNGIAVGGPSAGPWYGQDGIKLHVNATTWSQVASLSGEPARDMPVTAGQRLAVEVGVEAAGSVGKLDLVVHFFNASGALIISSTIGVLNGNQVFGTKISGLVDAPAGAATMRLELYGNSWGAGPGHFALLEPAVSAISGSQPVAPNAALDRVTTFAARQSR